MNLIQGTYLDFCTFCLSRVYRSEGTFAEDTARFYVAEILLALEYLHGEFENMI